MEEGSCRNCMSILEGYTYKFYWPTSPFTYGPSRCNWICMYHMDDMDVFLWEVYEKSKNIS